MYQRLRSEWPIFLSGRNLLRAALLATLTSGVWLSDANRAWSQLRTGNSERSLYQLELSSEESNNELRKSTAAPSRPKVRAKPAGAVIRARNERSIVEQTQDTPQESKPAPVPTPVTPKTDNAVPSTKTPPIPTPLPETGDIEFFGAETYEDDYDLGSTPGCNCDHCRHGHHSALSSRCYQTGMGLGYCGGPLSRLLNYVSVRGEVPLFWRRGIGLPPLVTTATAGTPSNIAGQLGQSSTQILLGNTVVSQEAQAGFRLTVGGWLDESAYRGFIVRYTNAGDLTNDFNFSSTSVPILARPFNNITTGTSVPDTQLVAYPNNRTGSILVSTRSEVSGFDLAFRRLAYCDRFTRMDWLAGYQHNHISENLNISSNTTITGGTPPLTGSSIAVADSVTTNNNFNGGFLGLMSSRQLACWNFETMFRLGMGSLERQVNMTGSTVTTSASGAVTTGTQGLLVRNTNNQPFQDSTFIVVPEVSLNAGYALTQNIDFLVGYNYLMLPKVAQPGRQLDTTVNLSDPLTGALRPQLTLDTQKYWLHSLNLGMQWRY